MCLSSFAVLILSQEIYHILPIILVVLRDEIQWPSLRERRWLRLTIDSFPGAIGHVDGVVHRRNRPGHRQSAYYRGDKRYHFVSSQVIVDHSGVIRGFQTGFPGHQQDQTNWNASEIGRHVDQYLAPHEFLLGDGIYFGPHFITPFSNVELRSNRLFGRWSRAQRNRRQVVEWTNGYLERFRALVIRCRHSIPVQTQAILAAALLSNKQLKQRPFRQI